MGKKHDPHNCGECMIISGQGAIPAAGATWDTQSALHGIGYRIHIRAVKRVMWRNGDTWQIAVHGAKQRVHIAHEGEMVNHV